MLVSVLAAILALAGVGEKSAQNSYLTYHIAASDDWAFYQAKNVRALMRGTEAAILEEVSPICKRTRPCRHELRPPATTRRGCVTTRRPATA